MTSSRWREYGTLLEDALSAGYSVVSLDDWVRDRRTSGPRCLVLRHDVDQRPEAALRMAAIEGAFDVTSTWYFRWRTAHPKVIDHIRSVDMPVGLHYESLTRIARASGQTHADARLIASARHELANEINEFVRRFGPINSICPHGDSRVPQVRNQELVRDQDVARFGVQFDGNEVLRGAALRWLTDRRGAGRWKDGQQPRHLFDSGVSPVVAIIHPNNWASRVAIAVDRLGARMVPDPLTRPTSAPICSRSELPPGA